jgi:hypothetical protein
MRKVTPAAGSGAYLLDLGQGEVSGDVSITLDERQDA